jgi:hypothetical protein
MWLHYKTRLIKQAKLWKKLRKEITFFLFALRRKFSHLDASITLLLPESKLERITIWSFPMLLTKLATFLANETIIPYCGRK